jgi:hypothetical protein
MSQQKVGGGSKAKAAFLSVIYVSACRADVLGRILASASLSDLQHTHHPHSPPLPVVHLAHHFVDKFYNRTGIYLISKNASHLCSASLRVCKEAFTTIDYLQHKGSHPALGVVDHVCFSPLMNLAAFDDDGIDATNAKVEHLAAACDMGLAFSRSLHQQEHINVYQYGEISRPRSGRSLQSIRKDLNYFSSATQSSPSPSSIILPDYEGESSLLTVKGLTCVGVTQNVVVNFNIRMTLASSLDKSKVVGVTALLRVPNYIEALTLYRGDQLEIACNLRSPHIEEYGTAAVLARATKLAAERGLDVDTSYCTGPSELELLDKLQSD